MTSAVRGERGSISIFIAVLALAFLTVTGLAVDGGRKLGALADAHHLADRAARAGAQAVDADTYRTTGVIVLDPTAAAEAATNYLATTGRVGQITVAGATVTVTVALEVDPRFFPGPWTVTGSASATATPGIEGAI